MGAFTTLTVLPFDNLSGDPEQAYFARGFVEDLITELSRFPTLEIVHAEVATAGGTPRSGHLLRGGVRRLGDVVRIAAQLVEAESGRQVWGERFDAPAERLLEAQDDIVARVASTLAVEVDDARRKDARRKPLSSLEVYDCWLRGLDCLHRGTLEDDERARAFFDRALVLDPHFARGHAGLSLSHFNEWSCQMWELFDEKQHLAFSHARAAAALDDRDALVQIILARVLLYRGKFDECARRVDRALELNPNDADVLAHAGMCRAYLGDPEAGLALAERAHRLGKNTPEWYGACAAVPLFLLGRYTESAGYCARAPRAMVDVPAYLAASNALAGDAARAKEALEMFLADFVEKITFGRPPEPGEPLRWLEHVNPFRRAEHAELFARGLRLAGLEADPDASQKPTAEAPSASSASALFRREGELWTAAFDGLRVQLSEAKGFLDLAELLSKPEVGVHCLDLAGRGSEPRGDVPVLDPQARRELAARARAIQEGIDEAEAHNDRGAAERGREELDKLVDALAGAVGLGDRSRRLGSAPERARTAVTWRIRNAIKKIAAAHPSLGRHLENAVKTGTYCEYAPEKPVGWAL